MQDALPRGETPLARRAAMRTGHKTRRLGVVFGPVLLALLLFLGGAHAEERLAGKGIETLQPLVGISSRLNALFISAGDIESEMEVAFEQTPGPEMLAGFTARIDDLEHERQMLGEAFSGWKLRNEEPDGKWRPFFTRFSAEIARQFDVLRTDLARQRAAIQFAIDGDWVSALDALSGYEQRLLDDLRRRRSYTQSVADIQALRGRADQLLVAQVALLDGEIAFWSQEVSEDTRPSDAIARQFAREFNAATARAATALDEFDSHLEGLAEKALAGADGQKLVDAMRTLSGLMRQQVAIQVETAELNWTENGEYRGLSVRQATAFDERNFKLLDKIGQARIRVVDLAARLAGGTSLN